jgi:hypothetical protein
VPYLGLRLVTNMINFKNAVTTCFLIFLFPSFSYAEGFNTESRLANIKVFLKSGLSYLAHAQKKETIGTSQFKGEWECFEEVDKSTPRIGRRGYSAYDSNVFTTASIHNSLAEIFMSFPEYQEIIPMLDMALENTYLYRNLDKAKVSFNFWQKLPIPQYLIGRNESVDDYPMLRRGNHFHLQGKFVWKASNVEDDADDTSLVLASFKLHQKIFGKNKLNNPDWFPNQISDIFDDYRDQNRKNLNFYNLVNGQKRNSGAFMTWLGREGKVPVLGLIPRYGKQYIPFGTNDVDCVVNTNILGTLALFDEIASSQGAQSSCRVVKNMISKNKHRSCGVYYPNYYNLYYTASRAHTSGVRCLDGQIGHMENVLIKEQYKNGAWKSNNKDIVQSTAYALGTLMNYKNYARNLKIKKAVDRGIEYLLSKVTHSSNSKQLHWEGGIFFSGGRVFRSRVSFRSSPYTTALILDTLAKYRKELESFL